MHNLITGCDEVADICFIVDSSASVNEGGDNWSILKDFLIRVVRALNVGEDGVHIGVVRFSDSASLQWGLDRYYTQAQQESAIRRMGYVGGFTNIQQGLEVHQKEDDFSFK